MAIPPSGSLAGPRPSLPRRVPGPGCLGALLAVAAFALAGAGPAAAADPGKGDLGVSALGRIEPEHGVLRISAPSMPVAVSGSVVRELHVDIGDDLRAGDLIAVLDAATVLDAAAAEARAQLALARSEARAATARAEQACVIAAVSGREAQRLARLREQGLASEEETEQAQGESESGAAACVAGREAAEVARTLIEVRSAGVARAEAELARARVHAPVDGRVLDVLARPGELAGAEGIVELGRVGRMYAIAEVYETDIGRVVAGQRAVVSSPALEGDLTGTVHRIRPKVHKQDEIGTDPAARKDARVVEVEVLLDEPGAAANLTHLQVEILIGL